MIDGVDEKKKKRKFSKKIKITILSVLFVLIILGFMIYNLFNFMIREDIILNSEPSYKFLQLRFGDNYSLPLSLSVDNNWLCTADCVYTLTDISSGKVLDKKSFQVNNHKELSIANDYTFSDRGYGQKMLQYLIECHNNPTRACPSGNSTYRRISTFIISYSPSTYQESMMSKINEDYTSAAATIYYSKNILDKAVLIYNISELKTDDLSDEKSTAEKMLHSIIEDLNSVNEYWKDDEFEKAGNYFNQKTVTKSANDFYEYSNYLFNESMSRINTHNKIIMDQNNMIAKLLSLNKSAVYYPDDSGYPEFKQDMMLGSELININTKKILDKDFQSYEKLVSDVVNAGNVITRISEDTDLKTRESKKDILDIYLADALRCIIDDGNVTNGSDNCKDTINKYPLNNYSIAQRCVSAKDAVRLNNITSNDDNASEILNIEDQSLVMMSLIIYYNESINDSNAKSNVNKYYNLLYKQIPTKYNYTFIKEYYPKHYDVNNTKYYSIDLLNINSNVQKIFASCHRSEIGITLTPFNQKLISIPETNLQDNKSRALPAPKNNCCIYGICTECCAGCVGKSPLIMLHGHSFNEKNSAYQSTEIFNNVEEKLVSENKYISIGIPGNILYDPEVMGRYDIPILIKPTYYITSFSDALGITFSEGKSGNVDTYALRLKEDIDYIKSVTKKDKIDIITHSMGGLVVRRYIQIFGSDSINKLIMISTPNNGIEDKQYGYCKLFGQINECDDIRSGSLFLSKLNDLKNQQKMPETYIIIGSGCDMNGEDGDGVVTVKNAKLSGYEPIIIKGSCQGTTLLHNEMLDIKKYPEVYNNITSILSN